MSNKSFDEKKSSSDQISTDEVEDKKFVSQAVAFVIGHARNGFVSLCASVASLLKEQTRLKLEVESLQQEISDLKESLSRQNDSTRCTIKEFDVSNKRGICNESFLTKNNITLPHNISRKQQQEIPEFKENLSKLNELTGCTIKEFNVSNEKEICYESFLTRSDITLPQSISKKEQGVSDFTESLSKVNVSKRYTVKELNTPDKKDICKESFLTRNNITLPQSISKKQQEVSDFTESLSKLNVSKRYTVKDLNIPDEKDICKESFLTRNDITLPQSISEKQQEILDFKESLSKLNNSTRCTIKEFNSPDEKDNCNESFSNRNDIAHLQNILKKALAPNDNKFSSDSYKTSDLIQLSKKLPYRKLKGCICSQCLMNESQVPLAPPLQKGMKVIIRGEINGVVQYVGHVDSLDFPEIFVGLRFSEPIGDSDGSIYYKVYFSVPKNYGMFVPLPYVNCVIKDCNLDG